MAKIFEQLSREGLEDVANVPAEGTEEDAAEQVVNEAEGNDAEADKQEIENAQDQIQDGEEAIDQLEAEIVKIDQALGEDTPKGGADETVNEANQTATDEAGNTESVASDNITSGQDTYKQDMNEGTPPADPTTAAVVAQEALRHISNSLGLDASAVAISHESIKNSPITSLRLTREGLTEVIEKVIRAIREFFQKIWAKIKTYAAKIMSYFANYTKQVEKLKNLLTSKDDKEWTNRLGADIPEELKDKFARRAMCSKPGSSLAKVCERLAAAINNNGKAAGTLVNGIKNPIGRIVCGIPLIGGIFKSAGEFFGIIKTFEEVHFGDKDVAKWYEVPQGDYTKVSVLRYNGSAMLVSDVDGKFRVSKTTLALKPDTINTIKSGLKTFLTKSEALSALKTLEEAAKRTSEDNNNIIKHYDDMMKAADKQMDTIKKQIAGDKGNDQQGREALANLRQLNLINSLALPELLFDRIDNFRNILYFIAESVKSDKSFIMGNFTPKKIF